MIFYTVDFADAIPVPLRPVIEKRVRQVINEPPKEIIMVKVTKVVPSQLLAVTADFACRVTACGVGGVPLPEEWSFILYRQPQKPDVLVYAQIRVAA